MPIIKITKDGISNEILAELEWAKAVYPNHTCEDITGEPTEENVLEMKKARAREWRNNELTRTDSLSILTDHPQKTQIASYRAALRNWPSTSDFPDTQPVME